MNDYSNKEVLREKKALEDTYKNLTSTINSYEVLIEQLKKERERIIRLIEWKNNRL